MHFCWSLKRWDGKNSSEIGKTNCIVDFIALQASNNVGACYTKFQHCLFDKGWNHPLEFCALTEYKWNEDEADISTTYGGPVSLMAFIGLTHLLGLCDYTNPVWQSPWKLTGGTPTLIQSTSIKVLSLLARRWRLNLTLLVCFLHI